MWIGVATAVIDDVIKAPLWSVRFADDGKTEVVRQAASSVRGNAKFDDFAMRSTRISGAQLLLISRSLRS